MTHRPPGTAPTPDSRPRPRRPQRRPVHGTAAALAAASMLLLSACGGSASGAGGPAATAAGGAGGRLEGGTIRYAHLQEVPCVYGGWVQQAYLSRQVLDSLVSQTDEGTIVPWLARSWTVSADRKTWTFHLKPGVRFTDGTPLDAQAVAANFEYWMGGGNGTVQAHLGGYYESARALDATTVQVKLTAPYSPLLSALSQAYFGIQSPTALRTRTEQQNCEAPIGSGPFTVGEWKRGESITLHRNPGYDSAPANARHQGPAYVDEVIWSFVPDNTSRYGSLVSDESDAIGEVPTVDFADARRDFAVQQYVTPGRPVTLSLNTAQGPFTDRRVRQAFAYASDRKANVDSAFLGVVPFEGNGYVSQTTPGYNASVAADYPHDPAKAAALLDAAGWTGRSPDGTRTRDGKELAVDIVFGLNSIVTQEGATALQNLQAQVKESGIKVRLHPVTQSELFSGAYSTPGSYDAQLGYWTSPHAGILYINYRPTTPAHPNNANTTFYNNTAIVGTIRHALSAATTAEANRSYRRAQQQLSDQAVAVGLYAQTSTIASQPDLKGLWLEASQGEPVFHDAYFTEQP